MLVVLKLNALPSYVFFYVFFLLHLEHLLVEYLLKFFIRVVDAKLLERIVLENLETKDVQKANEH